MSIQFLCQGRSKTRRSHARLHRSPCTCREPQKAQERPLRSSSAVWPRLWKLTWGKQPEKIWKAMGKKTWFPCRKTIYDDKWSVFRICFTGGSVFTRRPWNIHDQWRFLSLGSAGTSWRMNGICCRMHFPECMRMEMALF